MTVKNLYPNIRPSLDLNFAATKRLDPRITFSRASSATYVDADGLIKSAASGAARFDHSPTTGESLGLLVEEARTNLQLYSNSPDNAWWNQLTKAIDIVPNSITAPDNTVTAAFFPTGGQFGRNRITSTFSFYSLSCFVKASTATSIQLITDSDGASASCFATYTFSANSIVATMGGANSPTRYRNLSATSVNYPNGWIRLCFIFEFYANAGVGINTKYNLIGGSGYVWGAQLEAGAFPTSYIPTPATFTGRASTATFYDSAGIVQTAASGVARSAAFFPDENGIFRPAGLLLEAAGTNLLNHSQTFATSGGTQNDWADTNITRDGTLRTSPDGTANALRITASAANATVISSSGIGTSAARSLSVFLRRVTGSGAVEYTLDNGLTYTPQAISSSWVRYAFPVTTADQQVGIRLVTSGDAIELWGAQLEAGARATSYIPTTTTTVTRAADVSSSATVTRSADVASITGANFSSWYRQDEGTIYTDYRLQNISTPYAMTFNDGTAANIVGFVNNSNDMFITTASAVQYHRNLNFAPLGKRKQILAYASNNANSVVAGVLGTLDTAVTIPIVNRLSFTGATIGTISRLTYWPTRLSDATLQALTQ